MAWVVKHSVTEAVVGEHGTKKAATAQAQEMSDAHKAIDARHNGQSVEFVVVKVQEVALEDSPAGGSL